MLRLITAFLPEGQGQVERRVEVLKDGQIKNHQESKSQHGAATCIDKCSLSSSLKKDAVCVSTHCPALSPSSTPSSPLILPHHSLSSQNLHCFLQRGMSSLPSMTAAWCDIGIRFLRMSSREHNLKNRHLDSSSTFSLLEIL